MKCGDISNGEDGYIPGIEQFGTIWGINSEVGTAKLNHPLSVNHL